MQVMVVMALAGTGKTTTLVEYARRRPNLKFIYLTFNRSIMEDAATKFPSNTTCVPSLACNLVGGAASGHQIIRSWILVRSGGGWFPSWLIAFRRVWQCQVAGGVDSVCNLASRARKHTIL